MKFKGIFLICLMLMVLFCVSYVSATNNLTDTNINPQDNTISNTELPSIQADDNDFINKTDNEEFDNNINVYFE